MFGHWMGGAIAVRAAEVHQPAGRRRDPVGARAGDRRAAGLLAATRMTGALLPGLPALDLDNHDFSSDPAAAAAMDKDELVSQPPAPARDRGRARRRHRVDLDRPRHADDAAARAPRHRRQADRAGGQPHARRRGARRRQDAADLSRPFHDLVHEPKGAQVVADILAWLDAHTGGPPSRRRRLQGPLAGDPRGWTQAVESRAACRAASTISGCTSAASSRSRSRAAAPIGWHGALTARWANEHYAVALRPLGVAVRLGSSVIGLSGGIALVRGFDGPQLGAAAGFWYEQPRRAGAFRDPRRLRARVRLGLAQRRLAARLAALWW